MAKNPIQFQKGLSLSEHFALYSTEQQCHDALFQARWPDGFSCPQCGNTTHCFINTRKVFQCNSCHKQTSLTCGTIFDSTKLPLKTWFLAIYLLTQRKKSISALQLMRDIGVSYNTAWSMKHKIMHVMHDHQRDDKLSGRIEMDDAYIGGERAGKPGRGADHKKPFIAAVQTDDQAHPQKIHLRTVEGFRSRAIAEYARHSVTQGSFVISDGLSCFSGIEHVGLLHLKVRSGGGRKGAQNPNFKWVNTILGNVKNSITGTFHAISLKHVPRYLAEFEYRFNRRFALEQMTERFIHVSVRTRPLPYRLLKLAEV